MSQPTSKPAVFSARVIPGAGLGKKLGFPTANLAIPAHSIAPGIYAVHATVRGTTYWGLLHCGGRETVGLPPSVEVWIEDFDEDIYGDEITVEVVKKIRETKRFGSVKALQVAIAGDVTALQNLK